MSMWSNSMKCKYMFLFLLNNLPRKELKGWVMGIIYCTQAGMTFTRGDVMQIWTEKRKQELKLYPSYKNDKEEIITVIPRQLIYLDYIICATILITFLSWEDKISHKYYTAFCAFPSTVIYNVPLVCLIQCDLRSVLIKRSVQSKTWL